MYLFTTVYLQYASVYSALAYLFHCFTTSSSLTLAFLPFQWLAHELNEVLRIEKKPSLLEKIINEKIATKGYL